MWTPQGDQQPAAMGEISGAAIKQEQSCVEENAQRPETIEVVFKPVILLPGLDVQMLLIKDDVPKGQNAAVDPHGPKPFHIKEEQEDVCTSLQVQQLSGKDNNSVRFPVLQTAMKSEDDEKSPVCKNVNRCFPEEPVLMVEKPPNVTGKLPISRVAPVRTTKTRKQKKTDEEKGAKKRELYRARNKTRINIGAAFQRWRELIILKGFKNNTELATYLLDKYSDAVH
ncbi:uncharacterized protein V3H82_002787 [Fundulus diaphanus]